MCEDACVLAAVDLMRRSGLSVPDLDTVETTDTWAREHAAGVHRVTNKMMINRLAEPYALAATGYVDALASVIAHELAHQNGGDEFAAYTAQLRAVEAFGNDPDLRAVVEFSMKQQLSGISR